MQHITKRTPCKDPVTCAKSKISATDERHLSSRPVYQKDKPRCPVGSRSSPTRNVRIDKDKRSRCGLQVRMMETICMTQRDSRVWMSMVGMLRAVREHVSIRMKGTMSSSEKLLTSDQSRTPRMPQLRHILDSCETHGEQSKHCRPRQHELC